MKDAYNRKINYLRVSVTDRCNLRCRYCMDEEGVKLLPKSEILTIEDFIFVINTLIENGIEKVRITGGEPLIKKGILTLLEGIDKTKLRELTLTTNGVLLEEYGEKLKKCGVKRLNISLDTLKKEKFEYITRRNFFDKVINGIRKAKELNFNPLKINVVAIRGFNDDEILDFIDFAIKYELQIRFIEFMPFGEFGKDKFISNNEIRDIITQKYNLIPKNKQNKTDGPAKIFKIDGFNAEVGFISPLTEHFCSQCNRIRLISNGCIKTCLFSKELYSIKEEIKSRDKEKLLNKIHEILKKKPKKHDIDIQKIKFKKCQHEMNWIGG